MKRILSIIAIAAVCLSAVSCGQGNSKKKKAEAASVKSQAELQQEALVKIHLDSISADLNKIKPVAIISSIKDGKVTLTDAEKMVKPDYLMAPGVASDLQTLSQKYRAVAILGIDSEVAKLYDMPVADYEATLSKLLVDVDDAALKDVVTSDDVFAAFDGFYTSSKENDRVSLFWDASAAAIVEQLYIASQNSDKFLSSFTDQTASDFTYHISLLTIAIEDLASINPEYAALNEAIKPIIVINAVSVDQFKEQLASAKEGIAASREALLK